MMKLKIKKSNVYLGACGLYLPVIIMTAGMIQSTLIGGGILHLTVVILISIMASFLFSKNKKEFGKTMLNGMINPMLSLLILSFLLAGILSQVLIQSGLLNSILWFINIINFDSRLIPCIVFILSAIISLSCGTSAGALTAVAPLFIPLANILSIDIELIIGALISGVVLGNILSPISDITISTSLTQDITVDKVIKSNTPSVLFAGIISFLIFIYFGMIHTDTGSLNLDIADSHLTSMILIVLPVLIVLFIKKGWNLVSALLFCDILGILINLVLGNIDLSNLFCEDGVLMKGITGMQGIVIYSMLLFIFIEILKENEVFEKLLNIIMKFCTSKRNSEIVSLLGITASTIITAGGSPAIMVFGPMMKEIGKRYTISKQNISLILSSISGSIAGMLPYGTAYILCLGICKQSVDITVEYIKVIPYMLFNIIIIVTVFIKIILKKKGRK